MRIRLHKQARKNTCAVASLRTVLDLQLGVRVPEAALEAHGTDAHTPIQKFGTDAKQLRAMVRGVCRTHNRGKAWRLRVRAHGTVEDLFQEWVQGRLPMVSVYEPGSVGGYHMVVVLAATETHVSVFDPSPDREPYPRWYTVEEFLSEWGGDGSTTWYAVVVSD